MLRSLPEDLLNELDRLEALRTPPPQDGHRAFRRFRVRGDAELHPMESSRIDRTPISIALRDMGRGGLGFVCSQPLPLGSGWRICFLRRGYTIGEQAVMIRHCQQVRPDLYLIGGQFCIDTGLLALLGIEPGHLDDDAPTSPHRRDADFVEPGDVE